MPQSMQDRRSGWPEPGRASGGSARQVAFAAVDDRDSRALSQFGGQRRLAGSSGPTMATRLMLISPPSTLHPLLPRGRMLVFYCGR